MIRQCECPKCHTKFEQETMTLIDALDEYAKERTLAGEIFKVECPKCHKAYMIQYDTLYRDTEKKFMVFLTNDHSELPDSQCKPLLDAGFQLRRCDSITSFIEKIMTLDLGLDDRAIEYAKYDAFVDYIENKGQPEDITGVYFQGYENEVLKIKLEMDDKALTVMYPYSGLIDEIIENDDLFMIEDKNFPFVDAKWIIDIFEEAEEE